MSDVSGNMAAAAVVSASNALFFKNKKCMSTQRELLCWLLQRARMLPLYTRQLTDSLLFSLFIYPGQHTSSCPAPTTREKLQL
jgi:hypothetical protein